MVYKEGRKLRMAVIMDEFTFGCYSPECDTVQITPQGFKQEIEGFDPDLLFIESVWRGKDNLWRYKLNDDTRDFYALIDYCHARKLPVVFWSKEDPVHFGVFLKVAQAADYVFTTDADCIELYKAHLGHDRVYYLPFAAQPKLHNPIEEYERKDRFCFAGSFYMKYKERSRVFMDLAPLFLENGLDIYDRNYKKEASDNNTQTTSIASPAAENYYFPSELRDCILGGLPYSKISLAYKGYKYGVNMTSMVQSGFMFARRAFELLACNTVTVSNYSRGLELLFGDLLIATDDRDTMKERLEALCGTETAYRKYRLAGLRHVLASHLYEDRLDMIAGKVLGDTARQPLPEILVVCFEENDCVREMFERQTYERKRLLVGHANTQIGDLPFDYITIFSPQDYYGKNYLTDLALATRFASDAVIGKAAYYSEGKLLNGRKAYTRVYESVTLTRQMAAKSFFDKSVRLSALRSFCPQTSILSIDEFNYCENASKGGEAEDLTLYSGVPLDRIYAYTEQIAPVKLRKTAPFALEELYEQVRIQDSDHVTKAYTDGALALVREEDDDAIVWLRTKKNYEISEFTSGSRIGFFTETAHKTGNVRCQIEYYDESHTKLGFLNFALDGFSLLRISDRAKTFKLIFRMRGKSAVTLTSMYASSPDSLLPAPFPVKDSLLITESYPSYACPNQSSLLHRFAKEKELEVLLVGKQPRYLPYAEYDGIQIISSQYDAIREYLAAKSFQRIYVYQPSEQMRKRLDGYQDKIEAVTL